MTEPRETHLRLLFTASKKDVTEDILPDLLSFSYEDKESSEPDEISVTLKDETGKWADSWKPDGGEIVDAYLAAGDVTNGKGDELFCGRFYADSLRVSGSPRQFEMRAVSTPLNQVIRRRQITKAWETRTLKGIAQEIASEAGMQLFYDVEDDPQYDRRDQKAETNLAFLSRLCDDEGFSIKVTDERIVIFDQASYEKKTPIKTLELGVADILSWDFESQQSETYKACTVSWRDVKKKVKGTAGGYDFEQKYTPRPVEEEEADMYKLDEQAQKNPAVNFFRYEDPSVGDSGQEYKVKQRVTSKAEAERLAKATLRKLNRRSVTGSMTVVGDPSLLAGCIIEVKGFGSFDGNFIISRSSHSVSSGGYTTTLSLRRVNSNY